MSFNRKNVLFISTHANDLNIFKFKATKVQNVYKLKEN